MISKTMTAPMVKCYVNGKLLGIVTDVDFAIRSGRRGISGIDQNTIQEFVPTNYGVTGHITVLRMRGSGGLEGVGIVGFSNTTLLEKYIKIDLVDRSTDKILFSALNAVVTDQSWQVRGKQMVVGTFSFEASDFTNEAANT